MAVTQYIGARYVPIFADPAEWDNTKAYEPLTIVLYQGNSYTSAQAVPVGIDISNEEFWKLTGNYNAQIEAYRAEVEQFDGRITAAQETADGATSAVQEVEGALSTERNERIAADTQIRDDLSADLAREVASLNETISEDVERLEQQDEALDARITVVSDSAVENTPIYLGSWLLKANDPLLGLLHIGSIADTSEYQVVISSPVAVNTSNLGCVEFISIADNERNVKPRKTCVLGHAQSIAYVPETSEFWITPLFDYSGGSASAINRIYIYDENFDSYAAIDTPEFIQNVAYDKKKGKLYAYTHVTQHLYAVDVANRSFELLGTLDAPRHYDQGFAIYDDVWYVTNPGRNVCYGIIGREKALGHSVINTTASNRYRVLGELNGMDFNADGNLIATGDVIFNSSAAYDRAATVFEIPTGRSTRAIYEDRSLASMAGINLNVNENVATLRQDSTIESPTMAALMSEIFGDNIHFTLQSNIGTTDENIYLGRFSTVEFNLGGFTLNADMILCVGSNFSFQNGTYNSRKLNNYYRAARVSFVDITFGDNVATALFSNNNDANTKNAGLMVACGGTITNPNNVVYRGKVLAAGDVIIQGSSILVQ